MHRFGKVAVAVVSLALASCIALASYIFAIRRSASAAVAAVREMAVSSDPDTALRDFKQKFANGVRESAWCTPSDCGYELSITNRWLSASRLFPYTEMLVRISHVRGLYIANIDYRVAPRGADGPVVHVQWDDCATECVENFSINPHGRSSSNTHNGIVELNRNVTPKQREAAFALKVNCLTKFGGCQGIAEMLPQIWKQNGDGTIASRLRSDSDASGDWTQ